MQNINFTWHVDRIDTENDAMFVTYSAEGYHDITVGMPVLKMGFDMEQHIRSYAPRNVWFPPVMANVQIGHTGTTSLFNEGQ